MTEVDAAVESFLLRPRGEFEFPCLVVDARNEKVRKGGRVVGQAVLVVAGGRRQRVGRALRLLAVQLTACPIPQYYFLRMSLKLLNSPPQFPLPSAKENVEDKSAK